MSTTAVNRSKTYDLVYIGMFAVIIAVCSWISIPTAVPFTLQTFAVFLAVGVLGGKRGTLAVLVYILLGAVGIPVFSGFKGGIGALTGVTGGYIVGFLASALFLWGMEKLVGRKKSWILALQMVAALILCYAIGTVWFMVVYGGNSGTMGVGTVLGMCVIPFVIPDLIKIGFAVVMSKALAKAVPFQEK